MTGPRGRRALALVGASGLMAAAFGVIGSSGAAPAGASTVSVATEAEYRAALVTLNSATAEVTNTIEVSADITFSTNDRPVYSAAVPLVVNGHGHTVDAQGKSQFLVSNGPVTINDLTITRGRTTVVPGSGGAVEVAGALTLVDSSVENSVSTAVGGGIFASGLVTLIRSRVYNSSIEDPSTRDGQGGGVYAGSVSLTDSALIGNGGGVGGGVYSLGAFTATGSSLVANTVTGWSGQGGGAYVVGPATMTNSTVTNNVAVQGGGLYVWGDLSLDYTTVDKNTTTTGAANVMVAPGQDADVDLFGTDVSRPAGGLNCDLDGRDVTSANSFATDDSCDLTGPTNTENGANPQLLTFASFGGVASMLVPEPTSPLVDRIPAADCTGKGIDLDQRGWERPELPGGACDIGSVEVAAPPLPPCQGQTVTVAIARGEQPTSGPDVIRGTAGDDVIDGLGGDDLLCGLGGDDHLAGGAGADAVRGGPGRDSLSGAAGPDHLDGGVDEDRLTGGAGDDRLDGVYADDVLGGGPGADHLVGGWGDDVCDGGAGPDTRQTCESPVGFP